MLARLANRETPLHMTQFDWLCYCLDDVRVESPDFFSLPRHQILRSKQHTCTRYARFRSIGPVPGYSLWVSAEPFVALSSLALTQGATCDGEAV
eukprot:125531-Hanusia_phi.AAC.2